MENQKKQYKKVVLAYSGGLDTSIIIPWLKENYGCEVIAAAGDVGQGGGELEGLEAKALATGASKLYVMDLVDEFVDEKLERLLSFYENGLRNIGWESFRTISVKYKGQVVCTK